MGPMGESPWGPMGITVGTTNEPDLTELSPNHRGLLVNALGCRWLVCVTVNPHGGR